MRIDAHAGPNRRLQLAPRDDKNPFQNNFDYTHFDQLLTSEGFPFTVDHDTNYVHYAGAQGGPGGEYGGIPQNWHIQYCRGEPHPKSAADLGYKEGWNAEYHFFKSSDNARDGYDALMPRKPDLVQVDDKVNFEVRSNPTRQQ